MLVLLLLILFWLFLFLLLMLLLLLLLLTCILFPSLCSMPLERMGRKRSSVDLGINYPGDLLVKERQKKQLIKRNTIADFAATKSYQASTQSLISEQGKSQLHLHIAVSFLV